jgi:hypothetical protein
MKIKEARLRDIKRVMKHLGFKIEMGSKHFKFVHEIDETKGSYSIPAHNSDKSIVPSIYIKGICKHFGISEKDIEDNL